MRIALPIASLLIAGTLVGCGGEQSAVSPRTTGSNTTGAVATSATAPTASPTPEASAYEILTQAALEEALLAVDQLPPGYSQDPPNKVGGNRHFCDYTPPTEEKFRVRRDFTKGGGLSAELISITLRQFKSVEEASAAWNAMTETLKTCKGEVHEGTKLTYSPMSAPKLGDASTGVKVDADGVTLLQNFVLVGPVMISAGGGGLMNADADTIANLLETQVERYVGAAMN